MRSYYDPDERATPLTNRLGLLLPRHQLSYTEFTSSMRHRLILLVVLVFTILSSGCVYQAALSQGNLLEQEDIDQVEVGMTRGQVRFLLGTPMIDDPFHVDRWDYVYFLRVGRDKAALKRWISIYYDGDNVTEIVEDQELRADL
mgnify:CR=1 FL=1